MYNSKELFEVANTIGEEKLEQKNLAVFVGAFLAGLFISLGYLGYLYVTKVSNAFFGSLTFGTGLVMIIIAGGELFTGNCLLTITCFFGEKRGLKVLKNLSLVWLGNFVGAFFLVMLIVITGNALELKTEIIQLSTLKVERTFVEAFFRGVLGNVLVSLAVYLS
ncbi:MAG: formate/nitrite transporter family protein, partial [Bacilli bacterium]|nr:formate/nitrite transporter family protein [Bacilli bacterium]